MFLAICVGTKMRPNDQVYTPLFVIGSITDPTLLYSVQEVCVTMSVRMPRSRTTNNTFIVAKIYRASIPMYMLGQRCAPMIGLDQ